MKKTACIVLMVPFALFGCGAEKSQTVGAVDKNLPVCEQYFKTLEIAAEKYPALKDSFLQTLKNDKAALEKFGEAEWKPTCEKSLKKIEKYAK